MWKLEVGLWLGWELVEEGGHEVRVVDGKWELNQDILVRELRLLEAVHSSVFNSFPLHLPELLTSQW